MKLGKLGVWSMTDGISATASAEFAQRIEKWGYSALWMPEGAGRNVLVHAAWLLGKTSRLIVASGIANIYGRDAVAMVGAQYCLAEQSNGRFLLGIGVSHAPTVEGVRGHHYGKPLASMQEYLSTMKRIQYQSLRPSEPPKTVIAALGPKMLELAARDADGAHPYNVTPDHTALARKILGPNRLLCVEQKVLLETDPIKAREAARRSLSIYLPRENYQNSWKRLGFGDDDFSGGGSNRLMDAMVAWGSEDTIKARLKQHWDAGADHICIQPIPLGDSPTPDERILEALAPA